MGRGPARHNRHDYGRSSSASSQPDWSQGTQHEVMSGAGCEAEEQHAGDPPRCGRAVAGGWETFLYTLKAGPAGGLRPARGRHATQDDAASTE